MAPRRVPRVDKICGPGNLFVTLAKKKLFGEVGIDGIFGPSETLVVADAHADPALVAADLLAGAEHDELATAILLTDSVELAEAVVEGRRRRPHDARPRRDRPREPRSPRRHRPHRLHRRSHPPRE